MDESYSFPFDKFTSKSDSIFKNIPEESILLFKKHMVVRTYKKGQPIFLEGSYPSGVYYLIDGLVKKYKTDHAGKEHILYLCSSEELLGYSALLCNEPFPDSATAIETSRLGFLSEDLFFRVVKTSNELLLNLLSSLSHEFGVMVNSVTVFARMSAPERLALILLILNEKFKRKTTHLPVEIVLSREDLANMVGVATETLVRLLQELKNDGIIEIRAKKIIIQKPKDLIAASKFY